jgi:hypothetical protein
MLKDPKDQKTLNQVRSILNNLPESQKKLFRIVERPDLDKIGADPNVPLALALVEGVAATPANTGDAIRAGKGGTHGFFPDFKHIQTGFIVSGAGVKKGTVLPLIGLEDIAPLVAKLLGFPFNTPDGILYPGILLSEK